MPDQSALPALLERIRNATDADRELLLDAARALLQDDRAPYTWWARFKQLVDAGAFLDAALALCERVRPGCDIDFATRETMADGRVMRTADVTIYGRAHSDEKDATAYADSPVLALLAALAAAEMEEKE